MTESFPIKDLTRRKFQTSLAIIGLTICTATTIFLTIFGDSLGLGVSLLTSGKLTTGFSRIFSVFITFVSLLNILAGALITYFLVSLTMSERVRDIGIMKASGCLTELAFGYFATELSIIVFIGCIAGTVVGIFTYYASVSILNNIGFSIAQKPLNMGSILYVFLIFLVIAHLFGILPVVKAIRVKPAEALSPTHTLGTTFETGRAVPSKLGFTLKIAYRALVRRKSATRQAIICLAAILTLTTVTIVGGVVANQTTQSYVERAIGRDVIVISHPDVSEQYMNFLSQFIEAKQMEQINFLDSKYFIISDFLISNLSRISGVAKVDPRIILNTTIYEVQVLVINPEDPNQKTLVGDHRFGEALVLGIQPGQVINDWLILGRTLSEGELDSAIIGDSLASDIFSDALLQKLRLFGNETFQIVGICLDPLNKGNVVYIPFMRLSSLVHRSGYNIVFLKVDPSNRSQVLAKIEETISETGLEFFELNEILGKHLDFVNLAWSSVMLLPLSSLVTAVLCLLSYVMLSITGQQREFGIMRALGAKPKTILKIVFTEALLVLLISGAIGISTGLFVTFTFLIPDPVISQASFLTVSGWLVLTLVFLGLSSLYPVVKVVKKPIAHIISQPY